MSYIVEKFRHKNRGKLIITYSSPQALRATDVENVEKVVKKYEVKYERYSLKAQLRVLNGKDLDFAEQFVKFIKKYSLIIMN